jgi:hypothetical protein
MMNEIILLSIIIIITIIVRAAITNQKHLQRRRWQCQPSFHDRLCPNLSTPLFLEKRCFFLVQRTSDLGRFN